MKFQDPSMQGSLDVRGMRSVTDRQNAKQKAIGPKVRGIKQILQRALAIVLDRMSAFNNRSG